MVFRQLASRYPTQQLRQEMDRLLSDFFGTLGTAWTGTGTVRPPINAWETGEAVFVEMELPGVESRNVDISVVGNELTIKIDRPDVSQEGVAYHRRERGVGAFSRVVRLPVEVDADRVDAQMRNGVLTITLPKAPAARPRKIQVAGAK
jgi:HSP20 family protein